MLTTTKNTLLNKVLRLELDLADDIELADRMGAEPIYWLSMDIIHRNIESIKKQLKKL